jgi:hypothetical protein
MFYFREEQAAIDFAAKRDEYTFIDLGEEAEDGHRYAVRVIEE